MDNLAARRDSVAGDLVTYNKERPDQQLLLPDYRAESLPHVHPRNLPEDSPLALALMTALFFLALTRWLEPEKIRVFFGAFFSQKSVDLLMRDRLLFPPPGALFIVAAFLIVMGLSLMPGYQNPARDHYTGLLMWLPGGAALLMYWMVKHIIIHLWGRLLEDKEMPTCHILFSSQGMVLAGFVGLVSAIIGLTDYLDERYRYILVIATVGSGPLWTLGRTMAGVRSGRLIQFFYNLYYLCTLEILPLLGLWSRVPEFQVFWPAL